MLANLTPDGIVRRLETKGVRIVRDGSDLVLLGKFESLTAEGVSTLRSRKAELLAYLAVEDDTDFDPDGNPRPPAREIVIGADGGVGPPPANTASCARQNLHRAGHNP